MEDGLWGGEKIERRGKSQILEGMRPWPQLWKQVISQHRQIIGMRIQGMWHQGLVRFILAS